MITCFQLIVVLHGQPGFLTLKYKNNTLNVYVKEQYELMKLAKCDTLHVPLKCHPKACESIINNRHKN